MPDQHDRDDQGQKTSPAEQCSPPTAEAAKEQIPADLLKALEKNYYSRRRIALATYSVVALPAIALLAAAGWYLAASRPVAVKNSSRPAPKLQSPAVLPPAPVRSTPPQPQTAAVAIVQKPASSARKPSSARAAKPPSFIPEKGRDVAYSRQKPGWERYVGMEREIRVLRSGGRIKIVQVLSVRQHAISDAFLKSALSELMGSSDYTVTSREQKEGFLILRGNIGRKAEIVIYTQRSKVMAFAISVT